MTRPELRTMISLFLDCHALHVVGGDGWTQKETIDKIMEAIEQYENRSRFDPSKYSNLPNG